MVKKIIGISGKISSGKSFLANKLAEEFEFEVASFGNYLLKYSTERKLPTEREDLQNLGETFIAENPIKFLFDVIEDTCTLKNNIIIEGIRHMAIINAIKEISEKTITVFSDVCDEARYKWFLERRKIVDTKLSFEEFRQKGNHPVEAELPIVMKHCDLVFEPEKESIDSLILKIISYPSFV